MHAGKPVYDSTSPNWSPIRLVLSEDQTEMFMWMHAYIWPDGSRLDAYKHRITRQYLYLSDDCWVYLRGRGGALHLVDLHTALATIGDSLAALGWPRWITPADEAVRVEHAVAPRRHHRPQRRGRC